MILSELKNKQRAIIKVLPENEVLAIQLMEQGILPELEVCVLHRGLWGGPIAIKLNNTKIALGLNIAEQIDVELIA